MNFPALPLLPILIGSMIAGTCWASTDATCLVYQPIDMRSEGTVIKLPENGFMILAVPYLGAFSVPEKPYEAITRPYRMLSMRQEHAGGDSNLVSRTGIRIRSDCTFDGNKLKQELVTVDLSRFQPGDDGPALEVIVEATLECIRRTATDRHQNWPRPVLRIIGKPADDAVWKPWADEFNQQDFSKPFRRPRIRK